jgi:hypothetical protein
LVLLADLRDPRAAPLFRLHFDTFRPLRRERHPKVPDSDSILPLLEIDVLNPKDVFDYMKVLELVGLWIPPE